MTKINKDVQSISKCIPGYKFMDLHSKEHRNLNAFVQAYKDKMGFPNNTDEKKNIDDFLNLKDPAQKQIQKVKSDMNLFCKRCDFNLIDATAYHHSKLDYGKGTGQTINDVHRDIKDDRKKQINQSRKSKVDYG